VKTRAPGLLLLAALPSLAVLLPGCGRPGRQEAFAELALVKKTVECRLASRMERISAQIAAFAAAVAEDRDFSMKFLVDKDRSAPEVTEIARKYLEPMAFSVLTVTDSQYIVLSCGHFPANTGAAFPSARGFSAAPSFVMDNVKGENVLTVQAKARFTILDTAIFFAFGGLAAGKEFCSGLCCWPGYSVLVKKGSAVSGLDKVESISEVKGDTIVLNNVTYPAASISLPWTGEGDPPVLLIVSQKPLR
jgi:hypothetical protein